MSKPRVVCRCGHGPSWHPEVKGHSFRPCFVNRCMNVCQDFDLLVEPRPGETPIFGVHRVRNPWDDVDEWAEAES